MDSQIPSSGQPFGQPAAANSASKPPALTTGMLSPSEEEAKKAAACEAAEKLNEKIGKVKGKVVIFSSENESKPTPNLLHINDQDTSAVKTPEEPAPTAPINIAPSDKSSVSDDPQLGADPANKAAHQKQGSVHAHFLLGDVVHAGSRSRSGSGSRDRGMSLDKILSEAPPTKKGSEEVIQKAKPTSPPPTGRTATTPGIVSSSSNCSSESVNLTDPNTIIPAGVPTPQLSAVSVDSASTAPTSGSASAGSAAAPAVASKLTSALNGQPATNNGVPNTAGDPRLPHDDGKLHILLAATGSVSTGKLRLIIHKLNEIYGRERACIQIILTKAAEKFVSRGEIPSHIRIWRDKDEWENWQSRADPVVHIELRRWADILVIAPLSANTLGKIALGLCDNLLTCVVRAWNTQYPILIAPAMVSYAYNHPATRAHLNVIKEEMKWIEVLKPVEKVVGSYGDIGMGGMMDWNEIVNKTVLKLGGYPEDEDDDDDDNNDDNNGDEDQDDNEDDEDDDDNDDDNEAFADAEPGSSPVATRNSVPPPKTKAKKSKAFSFDEDDMDDDITLKKLSLADREELLEEKGKLRHASLTFD